ncbi:MAG: hypothetical protein E7214_05900 [Clostridium sp.]|nr:hypothetical protein [Clostridium sp.]
MEKIHDYGEILIFEIVPKIFEKVELFGDYIFQYYLNVESNKTSIKDLNEEELESFKKQINLSNKIIRFDKATRDETCNYKYIYKIPIELN